MASKELNANESWEKLLLEYPIEANVSEKGIFYITARQIKKYKEPRLMAKWDSTQQLPKALKSRKLNILPISRGKYVIGDFLLYKEIPPLEERAERMLHVDLPPYETIDANNINSEATAINALLLAGILDDFLDSSENAATFNGRMGTGAFTFKVNTYRNIKRTIQVNNAQCEIDGGFENDDSVILLEAKNVVHEDFNVRQLYYPYRLWYNRVNKPIRLVFSIYSNQIFRLFEYRFADLYDYSSIELINSKNYSLQDTVIEINDLLRIRENTSIVTDDNMENTTIPFIQANSMDRVVSLLENLYDNPMTRGQIAELMTFDLRQSDYYSSAGRYLGLFEKATEDRTKVTRLTSLGRRIYQLKYKERQLEIVGLILQHRIFAEFFDYVNSEGELPTIEQIATRMRELKVCNESQIKRRASSVLGWLKWIFSLLI